MLRNLFLAIQIQQLFQGKNLKTTVQLIVEFRWQGQSDYHTFADGLHTVWTV